LREKPSSTSLRIAMQFYSFRYGEMKVVQADAESPELTAVEICLSFKAANTHTVEPITLMVHIPHDQTRTAESTQFEAYRAATRLMKIAAEYCQQRTPDELIDETEKNHAFSTKG
jgi:hypothetical protein